jgi:tryptophan-rich sensory protein
MKRGKKPAVKEPKRFNWKVLIISLVVVYVVAYIGSIFTSSSTGSLWYQNIKPSITPPNWVFPIVWNVLFFLIALSLYLSWVNSEKKEKPKVALIFGLNLFLNILWSLFFFGMRNPELAFFELILLWLSIILAIFSVWRIKEPASYLLIPYLLWVSFAGILNYLIAF